MITEKQTSMNPDDNEKKRKRERNERMKCCTEYEKEIESRVGQFHYNSFPRHSSKSDNHLNSFRTKMAKQEREFADSVYNNDMLQKIQNQMSLIECIISQLKNKEKVLKERQSMVLFTEEGRMTDDNIETYNRLKVIDDAVVALSLMLKGE